MLPLRSLLLGSLFCLFAWTASHANPIPETGSAPAVMTAEDLTMTVGLGQSDIRGRFSFRADTALSYPGWDVTIRVPVLVPVKETGSEVVLADHWKLGKSEKGDRLRRMLFEIAKPKVVVHGRALPVSSMEARLVLPSQRPHGLGRIFHGGDNYFAIDARYAIVEFSFDVPNADFVRSFRCEIGYRQFHADITASFPEARYVPFFNYLPAKTTPATNPAYQIRIVAGRGVDLELISRNVIRSQRNSEYVIGPQHRKPIAVRVLLAPAGKRS